MLVDGAHVETEPERVQRREMKSGSYPVFVTVNVTTFPDVLAEADALPPSGVTLKVWAASE